MDSAILESSGDVIYLAMGLRNVGSGIGVLHGWYPILDRVFEPDPHVPSDEFRRLSIDLYIAAGGTGYWEAAVREPDNTARAGLLAALDERQPVRIDLLYGDQQGGQRTISRFTLMPAGDDGWFSQVARHWNLDRPDPR